MGVGAQRTDVHHAPYPGRTARRGQALRQRKVHALKGGSAAMQNRHQIHHRVVPGHQLHERVGRVDVGHHRGNQRQMRQPARRAWMPGWHRHGDAQALQGLAHVASNKAGATQNQNT